MVSYILISRSAQTLTCPRCLAITYLCKVTGGDVVDVVFVSDLAQSHRRAPVSGQFVTVRTKIQGPAGSDLGRCAMASRLPAARFNSSQVTVPVTTGPLSGLREKDLGDLSG